MAGIYIHIPFCKKICSYCDFYKSALLSLIPDFLIALDLEMELRRNYLENEPVETIYFGGGTPSLLSPGHINRILHKISNHYYITQDCEITLEANPDDLDLEFLKYLKSETAVNRLSIGIQSFQDCDLQLLNRRHNAAQSVKCINDARLAGFKNISIDLIYGIPGMKMIDWRKNLELGFSADHVSAYHLSIEPGTALSRLASRGLLTITGEDESAQQFNDLSNTASEKNFVHYEISNLAREGFFSRHNSNYWRQQKYSGFGPSAHSYDLISRQWNVANVKGYIQLLQEGRPFFEREELSTRDRFNEYVMVSLRTMWGTDDRKIITEFGGEYLSIFNKAALPFLNSAHLFRDGYHIKMNRQGWLISDYIITALIS